MTSLRNLTILTLFFACVGAVVAYPARASVSLLGESELVAALQANPSCCVIDARSESQRQELPLEDALHYRHDLHIVPTAPVVVIADNDAKAQDVGVTLAQQHPDKTILVVRGGASVWKAVRKKLEAMPAFTPANESKGVLNFVIPHNTCETGKPLQELTGELKSDH